MLKCPLANRFKGTWTYILEKVVDIPLVKGYVQESATTSDKKVT